MAKLNNAPNARASLEQRLYKYLMRHPAGVQRRTIDAHFRKDGLAELDAALRCLVATKAVRCTNGVWWAR